MIQCSIYQHFDTGTTKFEVKGTGDISNKEQHYLVHNTVQ